jgi:outer membrane protein
MTRRGIWAAGLISLLALLVGGVSPAGAQNVKLGFIRSSTIMDQSQAARGATEQFNREVEAWNQEAQRRKAELDVLSKELEAQSPMLSDQVRRQKEQDYQRKLAEHDQYVQSIWGPGGLVTQRNDELLKPIIEKIQRVTRKIAAEDGYDFILDASDGNIIYADKSFDLTQRVIEALNQPE